MSNNRSIKAQRVLVNELKKRFGDRVIPYTFECRFKKADSRDETQRTRMFLFSAIAFAICNQYGKNSFYVYENGVTSINLPKQTDLMHARASRTTHPKTIGLLNEFYRQFSSEFTIDTPYRMLTKEEIVRKFIDYKEEILIQSSVSCSTTRNYHELAPHCGCCSQCIDRRFATFAAGLAADFDDTYVLNLPYDKLNDEAAQRVANTLMFANTGIGDSATEFLSRYPSELMDVIPFWPASPDESLAEVYQLFCKYRDSIYRAEKAMNDSFSQLQLLDGSFLDRISEKKSHDDIEREKFESCIEHSVFVIINQSKTRQGSGFHLMDYGLITSHHVTCDGDFYDVFRYTEHPTKCGTISKEIGELCDDEQIDYALYKQIISVSCCFDIGDSQAMKIGDPVKIIGYPGFQTGDTYDCKKAELSRKTTLFGTPLFVVSSTIFHGESGGVVLNMNNQIVGLIRAGVESADEEPSSGKQGFVPIHLIIENIAQQGA